MNENFEGANSAKRTLQEEVLKCARSKLGTPLQPARDEQTQMLRQQEVDTRRLPKMMDMAIFSYVVDLAIHC